jgi:hypothetical protein
MGATRSTSTRTGIIAPTPRRAATWVTRPADDDRAAYYYRQADGAL